MICEICKKEFPYLDTHHIHSTSLGGSNKSFNKCDICPNCHALVHNGEIIIEGKYSSTAGKYLIWRERNDPSITGLPDPPVFLYGKGHK